ncbi:MAG: AMP-binding protein [Anaerolineales bacterium]|nr:AMP-binding protein [Anaerolineales bacterium]
MQTSLFDQFESRVRAHPNKPAILYATRNDWQTLTYQSLLDETKRFAAGLQACSLTPGQSVAVMTPPSLELFPFLLAMLKTGLIPVVVDPAIGLKKLGECLNQAQPDAFLGNALTHNLRRLLGWGKDSIQYNFTLKGLRREKVQTETAPFHQPAEDVAILFTSGSTGPPKGVLYSQENFLAQLDLLQQTFNITADELDLPAFPIYTLIDCLLGVTSVIPDLRFPAPRKTNPRKVFSAIERFKVTNLFASPVVLELLASAGDKQTPAALASLKRVITAGAPATLALQQSFRKLLSPQTKLFGIYGMTEALPLAKIESRAVFELQAKMNQGAGVCLGRLIPGMEVSVIPITEAPILEWQSTLKVETNVIGEIAVQGPAVTRKYLHHPQAQSLSKTQNGGAIVHRTGDVGYFDEAGQLWYCGRKSQRVILADAVLFTEQIENIFNAHPAILRSALVKAKAQPVLWVELKRGVRPSAPLKLEFMEFAKFHPQAARIKTFLFAKKFPTDARHNSKIIREELQRLAEKRLK